ncbi:STAS domain-containing protein [Dyella ginsengisoli]|uniref:STAS domain-containing protein n=1 Tax=Dyella ginsengisoli TaxID=363848 RepID=UPI000347676A|nr:STAS domain-containing protein [Dyella ginsengisoli]
MGSKASSKSKPTGAAAGIVLPADCRLGALDTLAPQLREAAGGGAATLDGAAVEKVDGAAMQLLVAFRRAAVTAGGSVSWAGASEVLHEAASLLGLGAELDLPAVRSA